MKKNFMVGVLSLQGAVREHKQHLRRCGAYPVEVKKPADLEGLQGLIIPGGESTTIGILMRQYRLDQAIIEHYHRGMGIFGTCAGLIMLSREVAGGKPAQPLLKLMDIKVCRNAFGRQRESFEASIFLKGLEKEVQGIFIRAPIITEAGKKVEVFSTLGNNIIAARQENILVVSFHPELTGDLSLHRFFLDICRG